MDGLVVAIGGWLMADGIYSTVWYWGKEDWRQQWPRLVRALMGLVLVVMAL
jgi:uncharacterized membrane protein HdeD (DUF308 family)